MERTSQRKNNKGKRWTAQEEDELRVELDMHLSVQRIAERHGRSIAAIENRTAKIAADQLLREAAGDGLLIRHLTEMVMRNLGQYRISATVLRCAFSQMAVSDILTALNIFPGDQAKKLRKPEESAPSAPPAQLGPWRPFPGLGVPPKIVTVEKDKKAPESTPKEPAKAATPDATCMYVFKRGVNRVEACDKPVKPESHICDLYSQKKDSVFSGLAPGFESLPSLQLSGTGMVSGLPQLQGAGMGSCLPPLPGDGSPLGLPQLPVVQLPPVTPQKQTSDVNGAVPTLYVYNLGTSVTEHNLENIFGRYGRVVRCQIRNTTTGQRVGIVNMADTLAAQNAQLNLSGSTSFTGSNIVIERYLYPVLELTAVTEPPAKVPSPPVSSSNPVETELRLRRLETEITKLQNILMPNGAHPLGKTWPDVLIDRIANLELRVKAAESQMYLNTAFTARITALEAKSKEHNTAIERIATGGVADMMGIAAQFTELKEKITAHDEVISAFTSLLK